MPDQNHELNPDTIVARKEDVLSASIDGQVVITSIDQGTYIGMEGAGNRIWALLERPVKIRRICETLLAEYDVSEDQCVREVLVFFEKLTKNGLLEIMDEGTGAESYI